MSKKVMLRKSALGTSQEEMFERVLYARNKHPPGSNASVVGGTPITEEIATDLRVTAFGNASCPPRGEWVRSPLIMRPADQALAYGLAAPRNGVRSLLAGLQAHVIKWLLFDSRPMTKDNKSMVPPDTYLVPNEGRQDEALWRACSEVIWRCGGGYNLQTTAGVEPKAVVVLPSDNCYVQHSSHYYQDQVTEKLIMKFCFQAAFVRIQKLGGYPDIHEAISLFGTCFLVVWKERAQPLQWARCGLLTVVLYAQFQAEDGPGGLLLLYSAMLSRGCENIKKDLDGKLTYLVSSHVEGSLNIVTLLLSGRATPYLHNGVVYVGDEDHYAMPQFGILSRSPVGLLVWYGGDDTGTKNVNKQYPGSRLKTPAFPIWVTCCSGHYGVLFNTNRELLRNYHAERRFDIHYYTCGGCHVLLNVDTRAQDETPTTLRNDEISATPLEKLIHTKWQEAKITWTGPAPNFGDN